jgi:uncharacterized protein (TIGR02646 family)
VRAITKGTEPHSLTAHRLTQHCDYHNYQDKDALRHSLVIEQGGICCYCMNRIYNDREKMKIEHWRPQNGHPAERLNYRNLLGACLGGHGQPPNLQHCDTRKGDRDLLWNPAEPDHHIETRLRYELDGSIRSDEESFDAQVDDVLNLNILFLKNNRKAVWVAMTDWWKLEKARLRGPVPRARFERERDRRVGGAGELEPFCRVAIWWLEQRLARMPT